MDLKDTILNIQCKPNLGYTPEERLAYTEGHNDALHDVIDALSATDDKIGRLRELLSKAHFELKNLPTSLGYEFTHMRQIEEELR